MIDKIDIHNEKERYKTAMNSYKKKVLNEENRAIISKYIRELTIQEVGIKRITKVVSYFSLMDQKWFKKTFSKITKKQLENFIIDLNNGNITSNKNKPYTEESKQSIKKFIKQFFNWLIEKNNTTIESVKWIVTKRKAVNKDYETITHKQLKKILSTIKYDDYRNLFNLLWDGGLRIEEALNLKRQDFLWDETDSCYKVNIRISKTDQRTISLAHSSDMLKEYFYNKRFNDNDHIFKMNYPAVNKFLKSHSKKSIGFNVTSHVLRHSSATHYAKSLNRFQLCYRYGWKMSSVQPDRYINNKEFEAGVVKEQKEKVINRELEEEIEQLRQELKKKDSVLMSMKEHYDDYIESARIENEKRFKAIEQYIKLSSKK